MIHFETAQNPGSDHPLECLRPGPVDQGRGKPVIGDFFTLRVGECVPAWLMRLSLPSPTMDPVERLTGTRRRNKYVKFQYSDYCGRSHGARVWTEKPHGC